MLLKEDASIEKLSGRYFTPQLIADFVTKWVLNQETNIKKILEPSVGDGVFLRSLKSENVDKSSSILAIEIDEETSHIAAQLSRFHHISGWHQKNQTEVDGDSLNVVVNDDFYHAYKNGLDKMRFQGILGNPPYIRYQYLTEEQREEQSEILTKNKMKPNKLINAWVSFTVACISCMDSSSRIGLVIPAELLQVKYSEDLRKFLLTELNRCTIVTFDDLVFDDIEQEVVLLLGEKIKGDKEHSIKVVPFKNADDLQEHSLNEFEFMNVDKESNKWTRYFLNNEQIHLINTIKQSNEFVEFSDVAKCEVGITTGNNAYFCINEEIVEKYDLRKYCKPLIARSVNIKGVQFQKEDWEENIESGARTYLLDLSPYEKSEFKDGVNNYIKWGEENSHNTSYKTRIRDEWYKVPSVWSPDIFFLRRNYQFPKVMLNTEEVSAVSTDTMHRVRLKNHADGKRLIVAYYTTVGLLFSELEGRSYGGGVLEILPSEVSKIMLPNIFDAKKVTDAEIDILFNKIDEFIRQNGSDNIEVLINELDNKILVEKIGLEINSVIELRKAWKKLQNRRLSRGRTAQ
ncbi:TPA: N-6 DNA methylase [Streptococcus agalactiae]